MKFNEARDAFYDASGKVSELVRNLSFIGFGIIWIFKDAKSVPLIPEDLKLPILLFAITISLDLLQYVAKTITWGIFIHIEENKIFSSGKNDTTDEIVEAKSWFNYIPDAFFTLKTITLLSGYFILIRFLIGFVF